MASRVIFDEGRKGRWAKRLLIGMGAVLLALVGIVRGCGG